MGKLKISRVLSRWRNLAGWQRRSLIVSLFVILLCVGSVYYCSRPDYLKRFDRPLSLRDALRTKELADFPFPPTAQNIYFAGYADWITHEAIIRFDASPVDCVATIQKVIKWHQSVPGYKNFTSYPTTELDGQPWLPTLAYLAPTHWWDGLNIKHGFYAGELSSGKPEVWVDSDVGRLYYHECD